MLKVGYVIILFYLYLYIHLYHFDKDIVINNLILRNIDVFYNGTYNNCYKIGIINIHYTMQGPHWKYTFTVLNNNTYFLKYLKIEAHIDIKHFCTQWKDAYRSETTVCG